MPDLTSKYADREAELTQMLPRVGAAHSVKIEAEPVQNSPVHMVNVWKDDDRRPAASVVVDREGYAWGHNYEHQLPEDTPLDEVAAAVIQSITS